MARPQKFRLTTDEVQEPQHARKLAGHVSEIEFFRKEIEKLQQQVADIYDAADEDGFDKKFVRKAVAKRAKDSSVLAAEEHGLEAYEMAIEKGMATRARERNHKNDEPEHDPLTGEITEPQPAKAAGQVEQRAALAISSERVAATSSVENEAAEISTRITEQQDASHPASDLTASPKLPQGQVAPIQPETANELPPASRGIAGEDDLRELAATVPGQIAQEGDAPLEASANVTGEGMSGHAAHLSTDTENPTRTPAGVVVTDRNGVTGGESAAKDGGQELSVSSAPASAIEFEDSASDAGQAPSTNSQTDKPVEASASAAPLSFADKIKLLRPNCQHPEACRSSGGKAHCGPCGRAAETGSAA